MWRSTACAESSVLSAHPWKSLTPGGSAMRLPKRLRLNRLRRQLIATYVIALVIATGALAILVVVTIGGNKQGLTAKGLAMQARWIAQDLRFDANGHPLALEGERSWMY